MELLKGKVALITGAARGIGKAVALKFAAEGCDIAFTDLKVDDQIALDTVSELEACGVRVKAYASNAASFDEAHQTVDQVKADFGHTIFWSTTPASRATGCCCVWTRSSGTR